MEAMWMFFLPPHKRLREEIEKGTLGEVIHVNATLGFDLDLPRILRKDLGGGTTLDLGVYTTYLAHLVFDRERPLKVMTTGELNEDGIDVSAITVLQYSKGRTATLATHARVNIPNRAEVFGKKGSMSLNRLFHNTDTVVMPDGKEVKYPLNKGRYPFIFDNSAGLGFEAQHVRECLLKGLKESPVVTHEDTMIVAETMESIRKQVGVVYNQD